MKLDSVKVFVVGNPPPSFGGRYFVFLKLRTACGIEGVGEVYAATFGPQVIAAMIEDLFARRFEGRDPFQHRGDLARGLRLGLLAAARHFAARRHERPGNGLLGHRRQGGRPAGLQPARRQGARAIAQLYLFVSRRRRGGRLLPRRGALGAARRRVRRAGIHGHQIRSRGRLLRLRPTPAHAGGPGAQRAPRASRARSGRPQGRSVVRDSWSVHDVGRDPPREAARALSTRCGSRSRCRPRCPNRWRSSRVRPAFRSRPASA